MAKINKDKYQGNLSIEDLYIGKKLIDIITDKLCSITRLTINSVEMFIEKNNENGIDSIGWYHLNDFNRRFMDIEA